MGEKTGIGWTDHTFNPWMGCNKVSAECQHCYISQVIKRMGKEPFNGPTRTEDWKKPFNWNRKAIVDGRRRRVFTCSLSDFFHPDADAWRPEAWEIIQSCSQLDWLVLTKRPELIMDRLPANWGDGYPNVWLGVTVGAKSSMDRIPLVQAIPARVRFVSAEPLLERLDFRPYLDGSIHWIITGCEQAHKDKRRLMDIEWVRDIDKQCKEAGIAHFFKQYYVGNTIMHNGVLDGVVRQEWPINLEHSVMGESEMTNEDQLKSLWLSHEQIRQLSAVLSDNEARKDFACQLRQQGYYAIFASDEGSVYESGFKRTVILEHTLGYFRPGEICDDAPSAEQRRHQYAEIERNLSTLVMEHGGVVLSICDDEPDEPEEDEDDFQECTFVECEFPTREDAESATACILDCWSTLGVSVFDEKKEILEGGNESLSSSQVSARTNKSPENRESCVFVRLANRSRERRETLLTMREEGRHGELPLETEIERWYAERDVLFSTARISWLRAGLPPDPTDEQLDQWMGEISFTPVCSSRDLPYLIG